MSSHRYGDSHQRGMVVEPEADERLVTTDGASVPPEEISRETVVYRCAECGRLHPASPTWPRAGRGTTWLGRIAIMGLAVLVGAGIAAGHVVHALAAAAVVGVLPLWAVAVTWIVGTFTRELRQLHRTEHIPALLLLGLSALPGFLLIHALPEGVRRRLPIAELSPAARAAVFNPVLPS